MHLDWKKVAVSPKCTIKSILNIIDKNKSRVALVVDRSDRLVGTITDGDIRRGIIRGVSFESPVTHVMNKSPFYLPAGTTHDVLIREMNQRDILAVPLCEGNRVIGLSTLHEELVREPVYENPVFVMAGGFGTRLKPLTDTCPKPMLKVGDKPILEIVIRQFKKLGFVNFFISTHYMPEQIHAHFGNGAELGVNITYLHEDEPLGTGGALSLISKELDKDLPVIMMNGDVLTKVDFHRLLEFHHKNNADATMCVREYDYQIPYGVVNGEGNKVTEMVEKPIKRYFVNAGIYVVSPKVIHSVPENQAVDMPTLLEQHIQDKRDVLMFPVHEYWLDIGRMDDFNRAQADIRTLGLG